MKTHTTYAKSKYGIWPYGVLIIVSLLASFLAVKNIILTSDSFSYSLVSQQILAGSGIRIPISRFDNIIPVDGTVPFLVQPPLTAVFYAMLGGVTPDNIYAAQLVNMICHGVITIITFLLMKRFFHETIAFLSGIIVAISLPLMDITHHMTSEALFIALTITAMYFLILSRQSYRNKYGRDLLLAGIFGSGAIMARYAGIALIVVFLWEMGRLIKNQQQPLKYGQVALAVTMPIFTIAGLFIRNYIYFGSVRGINLPDPERSFTEAVAGTFKMVFMQFQLGKYSSLIIISLTVLFAFYIFIHNKRQRAFLKYFHVGFDLPIIYVISYTAMICVTMTKDQPVFELRYVTPLVPYLLMGSIFCVVFGFENIKERFPRCSLYGLILTLFLIFSGVAYKTFLNLPEFSYKQVKVYSILDSCTYNWLKENYANDVDVIIATNKPYRLSFFGGYSTIILPNRKFVPNAWMPEDMENTMLTRMSEVGARHLVLFEGVNENAFGSYIAELFNKRETNDKFNLLYECGDGVVYGLKR